MTPDVLVAGKATIKLGPGGPYAFVEQFHKAVLGAPRGTVYVYLPGDTLTLEQAQAVGLALPKAEELPVAETAAASDAEDVPAAASYPQAKATASYRQAKATAKTKRKGA